MNSITGAATSKSQRSMWVGMQATSGHLGLTGGLLVNRETTPSACVICQTAHKQLQCAKSEKDTYNWVMLKGQGNL